MAPQAGRDQRTDGENYGHIIVDECHHVSADSFEATLKRARAQHANKTSVRIIDFVDSGHPALIRMWERRQRGYKAMGYRFPAAPGSGNLDFNTAPDDAETALTQEDAAAGTK